VSCDSTSVEIAAMGRATGRASIRQLEGDIRTFSEHHDENPKPYRWTKSADKILLSLKRFCHKAQQTSCGEL
jgi:hypothetical protein